MSESVDMGENMLPSIMSTMSSRFYATRTNTHTLTFPKALFDLRESTRSPTSYSGGLLPI